MRVGSDAREGRGHSQIANCLQRDSFLPLSLCRAGECSIGGPFWRPVYTAYEQVRVSRCRALASVFHAPCRVLLDCRTLVGSQCPLARRGRAERWKIWRFALVAQLSTVPPISMHVVGTPSGTISGAYTWEDGAVEDGFPDTFVRGVHDAIASILEN